MDFVANVIKTAKKYGFKDQLFFNRSYGSGVFVNTNDLLFWGVADAEEITPENFYMLIEAVEIAGPQDGPLLFTCWVNEMRPQGAFYPYFHPGNRWWFNECGPFRRPTFGDPVQAQL